MVKIIIRWRIGLLLLATLVTSCVSFDSVKQTATLGTQLSSQENVFDKAPELRRIAYPKTGPDSLMSQFENDVENWHKVNHVIVAYAKALNAMADNSKDKSYKDDVSTMLGAASKVGPWSKALNQNVTTGVSAGVDALISAITSSYRRAELKMTIEEKDGHIQNIKAGFDNAVKLLDSEERNIQRRIDAQTDIESGALPQNMALCITYRQLSMAISDDRKELANYEKAFDAFALAHHDLKGNINKVGNRKGDLEVLQEISKDVSTIATNINKASTPPTK